MITAIIIVFITGYLLITAEHPLRINKSASALVTGVLCWTIYILFKGGSFGEGPEELASHFAEISGILFFLLSAMTIVELIDSHDGFDVITSVIQTRDKKKLLWIICFITFFLSAILDNLTTTIVMVTLLRKLINDKEERWLYSGMVIIAANAGGAWSPIGDVTTTMLWIGGQITTLNIIKSLIIPSLVTLLVPLLVLSMRLKGNFNNGEYIKLSASATSTEKAIIFYSGIGALLFVPAFKSITHLPPFMGILLALGIVWIIVELVHWSKDDIERGSLSVGRAMQRIDTPSILFFLGILLAVSAMDAAGILHGAARLLNNNIQDINMIIIAIGALSSVVDNVPLVAAVMGMYDLSMYPTDHYLWEFIAFAAGTGGSMLIIGSAAGVACMGIEKITFGWYLKNISWLAAAGFLAGSAIYIILN
jgi:Na+/H+ antiporter NhaD/arsenite permease-like protein